MVIKICLIFVVSQAFLCYHTVAYFCVLSGWKWGSSCLGEIYDSERGTPSRNIEHSVDERFRCTQCLLISRSQIYTYITYYAIYESSQIENFGARLMHAPLERLWRCRDEVDHAWVCDVFLLLWGHPVAAKVVVFFSIRALSLPHSWKSLYYRA